MTEACRVDARVALLRDSFRRCGVETLGVASRDPGKGSPPRSSMKSQFVHDAGVSSESWETLDAVDLAETFLQRVPLLQSCPNFLRGRLRFCFSRCCCANHKGVVPWDGISWHTARTSSREDTGTVCCVLQVLSLRVGLSKAKSRARQALTGATLAPRNERTREELQSRRPKSRRFF